jgi:hypothetical protein
VGPVRFFQFLTFTLVLSIGLSCTGPPDKKGLTVWRAGGYSRGEGRNPAERSVMTHNKAPSSMKTPIQQFTRLFLLAVALLTAIRCAAGEEDKILFFHLKLTDQIVTLVDSTVRPGRLKEVSVPEKRGTIYLELTSTNGTALWSDVMADPAIRRFEYEDPDQPGNIKAKEVITTVNEFTVRVPFHKGAQQLKLFLLDKPANRLEAAVSRPARKALGTVGVPALEAKL